MSRSFRFMSLLLFLWGSALHAQIFCWQKNRGIERDSIDEIMYQDSLAQVAMDSLDAMLFHDPFDDNHHFWDVRSTSRVAAEIQEGWYRIRSKNANGSYFFTQPINVLNDQDFYLETSMTQIAGAKNMGYGLVWGIKDSERDYFALLVSSNRQYTILHVKNGRYHDIKRWTPSKLVNGPNKENILGIRRNGDLLEYYINGRMVFRSRFEHTGGNRGGIVMYGKMKVEIDYLFARDPLLWSTP